MKMIIDKPMASLSTCHLELVDFDRNHIKSCKKTNNGNFLHQNKLHSDKIV